MEKFVPAMVMSVPPRMEPEVCDILVTVDDVLNVIGVVSSIPYLEGEFDSN